MTRLRIVNLLDDFSLGGVSKGLRVFEAPELAEFADFETIAVDPKAVIAAHFNADVIIAHQPPNWRRIAYFHSLRLRNPQARLIYVEHSYSKEWAQLHVPNMARFLTMVRLALAPFDDVVTVSKSLAQWFAELRIVEPHRLHAIYPYSGAQGIEAVPDPEVRADQPLIIGAYGRFCDAKGFDRLIDAFKRCDTDENLRLVIGGMGPDEADLHARAMGCERISFVGKVTDVPGFLANCHVMAVPSRYETYGQVANEARTAGRPVLTSMSGGLPEQVGSGGLIVDCDDPDALLAALQSLRAQPLAAMGRAGRESTRLDQATRVAQWCDLLRPATLALAA